MPFDVRRGDPITVALLQRLYNGEPRGIRATGGIGARQTPDGQIQIWGSASKAGAIAPGIVGSGGITAASYNTGSCTNSGTKKKFLPGSGEVYPFVQPDAGSTDAENGCKVADTSEDSITALSISTTTGGIPANTLILMQQDNDGNWWICSADCGN